MLINDAIPALIKGRFYVIKISPAQVHPLVPTEHHAGDPWAPKPMSAGQRAGAGNYGWTEHDSES